MVWQVFIIKILSYASWLCGCELYCFHSSSSDLCLIGRNTVAAYRSLISWCKHMSEIKTLLAACSSILYATSFFFSAELRKIFHLLEFNYLFCLEFMSLYQSACLPTLPYSIWQWNQKSETVFIFKWTLDKKLLIEQLDEAWGPSDSGNSSNTAVYVVHLYEKKQHEKKGKKKQRRKKPFALLAKTVCKKFF